LSPWSLQALLTVDWLPAVDKPASGYLWGARGGDEVVVRTDVELHPTSCCRELVAAWPVVGQRWWAAPLPLCRVRCEAAEVEPTRADWASSSLSGAAASASSGHRVTSPAWSPRAP